MSKKEKEEVLKDGYYLLTRPGGEEPLMGRLYFNSDAGCRGFGFNTHDGGGFLPLSDITSDTTLMSVNITTGDDLDSIRVFQKFINQSIQRVHNYDKMPHATKLLINGLALSGEAGEVGGQIKRMVWYGADSQKCSNRIKDELGDVLYHAVQTATEMGFDIGDILIHSINKTADRNKVPLPEMKPQRDTL